MSVILGLYLLIIPGEVSIFSLQFYVFQVWPSPCQICPVLFYSLALLDLLLKHKQVITSQTKLAGLFWRKCSWTLSVFQVSRLAEIARWGQNDRHQPCLVGDFHASEGTAFGHTGRNQKSRCQSFFFLRQGDIFSENDTLLCEISLITPAVILIYLLLTFEQKLSVRKKSPEFT